MILLNDNSGCDVDESRFNSGLEYVYKLRCLQIKKWHIKVANTASFHVFCLNEKH